MLFSSVWEDVYYSEWNCIEKLFISNSFLNKVDDKAQVSLSWGTVADLNDGPFSMILFIHK